MIAKKIERRGSSKGDGKLAVTKEIEGLRIVDRWLETNGRDGNRGNRRLEARTGCRTSLLVGLPGSP